MNDARARVMLAERLREPPVVSLAKRPRANKFAARLPSALRLRLEESSPKSHATRTSVVVMSIRPEFADQILSGRKRMELRRRVGRGIEGARVYFYVTAPVGEIRLSARVAEVVRAEVDELWKRCGAMSGVSRRAFDSYFDGLARGVGLVLEDVRREHVSAVELSRVGFVPPRSMVRVGARSGVGKLLTKTVA